ncbi:MAG: dioxygenase [Chloroflexi bacterium]|nr:dioxygenase [Chloroflexota bacterium]
MTLSIRKQPNQFVRFALGMTATAAVLGAALAPTVLAQTVPAQTAPLQSSFGQPPATSLDASVASTTLDQTAAPLGLTVAVTEGPYFKAGSPETTNLIQGNIQGQTITVTGQALDQTGQPVANALLDFWQANASGVYDNSGYTLRGHQYTDANGYYMLTTVVPGLYPGRTEHIHVRVQAPGSPMLTSQLFFPGVAQNGRDSIYSPSLLMDVVDNGDGTLSATYNFVVATA